MAMLRVGLFLRTGAMPDHGGHIGGPTFQWFATQLTNWMQQLPYRQVRPWTSQSAPSSGTWNGQPGATFEQLQAAVGGGALGSGATPLHQPTQVQKPSG